MVKKVFVPKEFIQRTLSPKRIYAQKKFGPKYVSKKIWSKTYADPKKLFIKKIGPKKNFAQKNLRAQIAKNAEVKDELPKLLTIM